MCIQSSGKHLEHMGSVLCYMFLKVGPGLQSPVLLRGHCRVGGNTKGDAALVEGQSSAPWEMSNRAASLHSGQPCAEVGRGLQISRATQVSAQAGRAARRAWSLRLWRGGNPLKGLKDMKSAAGGQSKRLQGDVQHFF